MEGIFYPPDDPAERESWLNALHQWRQSSRLLMDYDDSLYRKAEFAWIRRNFALGFLMMSDLQFYDPASGRYTIDRLLDAAEEKFGGYDAIILWHAFPRIGFDQRNQFDFYRQSHGGLAGLRGLVDRCHERDVKVYIAYMPWDTGTRREWEPDITGGQGSGAPPPEAAGAQRQLLADMDALIEIVTAIDADALFLDTMEAGAEALRTRLDQVRPGVVLESEVMLPLQHLHYHGSSWAQAIPAGRVPGVLRNKWFERRHMQHRIKRLQRDHTEELHLAWMNGAGVVIWENVFGIDRRWSPRDRSILKVMLPIQRRYAALFSGEGWQPLIPMDHPAVCASRWEGNGLRLWTLCNQAEEEVSVTLPGWPEAADQHYFDLVRGVSLKPSATGISLSLRPRGVGALLAGGEGALGDDFAAFLKNQRRIDSLANFDPAPPEHVEILTEVKPTRLVAAAALPKDMVLIPARRFELNIKFRVRACGFYQTHGIPEVDVHFRFLHQMQEVSRPVDVAAFALDKIPVTNAAFARFLQQSGYRPANAEQFLKHWPDGQLPTALEDHPVVYVDLADMRAFAQWAGKRLPTEEEWQHAAQGFEERIYPWGDQFLYDRCNGGAGGMTTPVKAFPDGCSPFGCFDMCGNVWEMTESERTDGQTRSCILKGGSYYAAQGSQWYTDGGPQRNDFAAKMLLSFPGWDRCSTIGFRCAVDLD